MSARTARIRVVDQAGRPVAGARVAVVASSVPFPEIGLLTDDDGTLQFGLPGGQFTFRVVDAAGRAGVVNFEGEEPMDLEVRLGTVGGSDE